MGEGYDGSRPFTRLSRLKAIRAECIHCMGGCYGTGGLGDQGLRRITPSGPAVTALPTASERSSPQSKGWTFFLREVNGGLPSPAAIGGARYSLQDLARRPAPVARSWEAEQTLETSPSMTATQQYDQSWNAIEALDGADVSLPVSWSCSGSRGCRGFVEFLPPFAGMSARMVPERNAIAAREDPAIAVESSRVFLRFASVRDRRGPRPGMHSIFLLGAEYIFPESDASSVVFEQEGSSRT